MSTVIGVNTKYYMQKEGRYTTWSCSDILIRRKDSLTTRAEAQDDENINA